jgi:hypothetical protein
MKYKNQTVERDKVSGYYKCFVIGVGWLRADTYTGLKKLVNHMLLTRNN